MDKIIILGGGGHARVLIDLVRLSGTYKIAGILDPQFDPGTMISGIPVLGNDDMLPELVTSGIINACIGTGSVKDTLIRKSLYDKSKAAGLSVPPLIHPRAVVSENSKIAAGAQIMANAVVQTDSMIGENTIINTGAIIEHDCCIGTNVHICPAAVISGVCRIDEGSFIGAGATVINGINIGKNVTIAAGSVVITDVADGVTLKGVPAK